MESDMARTASGQPTDGEIEILQILWQVGPASLGSVCDVLRSRREVAASTVATMLRLMSDKGLVKRTGSGRGATWAAAVSRQKTERGMVRRMVEHVFDGSADRLAAHLVEGGALSDKQLTELRTLIDARTKKKR
jgi:BlaI family penicillinase repressor